MWVFISSTDLLWNISHYNKKWARYDIKMYSGLHVKYPLSLSDYNETWIFWTIFGKMLKYRISWISDQREASCSTRTDRRTGMMKLIDAFRNFAKATKKPDLCCWTPTKQLDTNVLYVNVSCYSWTNITTWLLYKMILQTRPFIPKRNIIFCWLLKHKKK